MQQDEMAELKMEVKALKRQVSDLWDLVNDLQKNASAHPQRDTSQTPAPRRTTDYF